MIYGIIAQLGEHLPYKQGVIGSSPIGPIYNVLYVVYGGIAQLARAHGSYPWCRWFKSSSRYFIAICSRVFFVKDAPTILLIAIFLWRDSSVG